MINTIITRKKSIIIYSLCFLLLPFLVFAIVNINNFDLRSLAGSTFRLADNVARADLNYDDKVSILDFSIWISYYKKFVKNKADYNELADLNKDQSISIRDYMEWINAYKLFTRDKGNIPVNVELSLASSSINVGESTIATASVMIEDGNIEEIKKWEIEDPSIATLSGENNSITQTITGVSKGTTNITVTTVSGATASLPIQVQASQPVPANIPAIINVEFPDGTTAHVGEDIRINVILMGETNDSISVWESTNTNVIDIPTTLEKKQTLHAKEVGTTKFTIITKYGSEYSTTLTVIGETDPMPDPGKAEISVNFPNGTTAYVDDYITMNVTLIGGINDFISAWESSNTDVIDVPTTLASNQELYAKSAGTTVFTIITNNGSRYPITLTVKEKTDPTPNPEKARIVVDFPNGTTAYVDDYITMNVTLIGGINDFISAWESSNTDVIDIPTTLASDQELYAKSAGTTDFTIFTNNGAHQTVTLKVLKEGETMISINLPNGDTAYVDDYITVEVSLTGSTDDSISSWESSNNDVIEAPTSNDLHQELKAKSVGTTVLTVHTKKGAEKSATLNVIEKPATPEPAKVYIQVDKNTVHEGEFITLDVTLENGINDSISRFESSNPEVIDTPTNNDPHQVLEAKKAGTTKITVYTTNGGVNYITLTVEEKEKTEISINLPNGDTAYVDHYITIEVSLTGSTNDSISSWDSSNNDVIEAPTSNDLHQELRAKSVGTTVLTVHTKNGAEKSVTLNVIEKPATPEPAEVYIQVDKDTVYEGEFITLDVTLENGINDSISRFDSSNPEVIDIPTNNESHQVLEAKKAGTTKFTVYTTNGGENSITLTVEEKRIPASIELQFQDNNTTVYEGEDIILQVILKDSTNDSISRFTSSNEDVIAAPTNQDSNQTLHAKKEGTTDFTVYTENGSVQTTTLTVLKKEPTEISLEIGSRNIHVGSSTTVVAELTGNNRDKIKSFDATTDGTCSVVADITNQTDRHLEATIQGTCTGTITITILSEEGSIMQAEITVQAAQPAEITMTFDKTAVDKGDTITLEVALSGNTNDSISGWESSNTDVIDIPTTLGNTQTLYAKEVGTTTFTVHTKNGGHASTDLTVKKKIDSTLSITFDDNPTYVGSYKEVHVTLTGNNTDKISSFEAETDGSCTITKHIEEQTDNNILAYVDGNCAGTITITVHSEKGAEAQAFITVEEQNYTHEINYNNYKFYAPYDWNHKYWDYYRMKFDINSTGTTINAGIISIENLENIKSNPQKVAEIITENKSNKYCPNQTTSSCTIQVTNHGVKTYTNNNSEYYYFDIKTTDSKGRVLYIPTPDNILFEVIIASKSPDSEEDSILHVFKTATVSKSVNSSTFTRTIMIFSAPGESEEDYCMGSYAFNAILPSEIDYSKTNILLYTASTNNWCNSIINNNENAIYKFTETGLVKLESYSKSPIGASNNLKTFLNYVYDNYHTDKYDLIMDDHGLGTFGLMYDSSYQNESLNPRRMSEEFSNSNLIRDNKKLDSIILYTSLNANLELLSYIHQYTNYIVASEESITYVLNATSNLEFINYVESLDTFGYAQLFVDTYTDAIEQALDHGMSPLYDDVTYTIFDSSKISSIVEDTNSFFSEVNNGFSTHQASITQLRNSTYQFGLPIGSTSGNYYNLVDLKTIVSSLKEISSTKADKLITDLNSAVLYNKSLGDHANGLSVYFPISDTEYIDYYSSLYSQTFPQYVSFVKRINNVN